MSTKAVACAAALLAVACGDDGGEQRGLPRGLAYVTLDGADGQLWFLPVNETADPVTAVASRLDARPGTEGRVSAAAWSPGGGRVAALVGRLPVWDLHVYSAPFTGDGEPIATEVGDFVAWDPAGERLLHVDATTRRLSVTRPDGYTAQLSTGDVLTSIPQSVDYQPSWSPDGGAVAFKEDVVDGGWRYHVVTLTGVDVVTDHTSLRVVTDWLPSGAGVLGRVLEGAEQRPALLCLATGALAALPPQVGSDELLASPDGRRLLMMADGEAIIADVDGCIVTERARTPMSTSVTRGSARWTGDGQHVFFTERGTMGEKTMRVIDPGPPIALRTLSAPGQSVEVVAQLPTGSRILWTELRDGRDHLMISGPDAVGASELVDDIYVPGRVRPSPAGDRVAYITDALDGDPRIEVIGVDGGAPAVIHAGTSLVSWSPTGDAMTFVAWPSPTDMVVTRDDGTGFSTPRLLGDGRRVVAWEWSP